MLPASRSLDDELKAGYAQECADACAERVSEDPRRRPDAAVQNRLQCGERKQAIVPGGDGAAEHSYDQRQVLDDGSRAGDPNVKDGAESALGERDDHHGPQCQGDDQVLGERRHFAGFPLAAR